MKIKAIQPHLKQLCKKLGPEYRIVPSDFDHIITRDFDNGFSVGIMGINSSNAKRPAQIYLWDLRDYSFNKYGYRNGGYIAAEFIIPQDDIAAGVEWIHEITEALLAPDPGQVFPVLFGKAYKGWDVPIMPQLRT